ncbi:MAG: heme-binding protein [Phycisphaerales bacterium]|nr:MAG: heme-binding protein [Phycisphaerales bacterium]
MTTNRIRSSCRHGTATGLAGCLALLLALLVGLAEPAHAGDDRQTVLRLPMRTAGPNTLDPAQGSTTYENMAVSQIYETLLQPKYTNPNELEPLLLAEMPTKRIDEQGRTVWRFKLRDDAYFHDNPCFPGGKGRRVTTDDVFYSWKRLADQRASKGKNWWLLKDTIVGFDEYKARQDQAPAFDYDQPVEGLVKISDTEFEVVLKEPVYRFIWVLQMFQTSIVPREAVEYYNKDGQNLFSANPVGTGPYVFHSWQPKQSFVVVRNPNYREAYYPADGWSEQDRQRGLDEPAGRRIPFVDRLEFSMYVEDNPLWLDFENGKLGYIELPYDFYENAFNPRTGRMDRSLRRRGVQYVVEPQLDFIFRSFNMEDELVGGYTPEKIALRRAISLAMDLNEINESFYAGLCTVYDGPIPPGLEGHPEGHTVPGSFRGPNLELAREYLAKAGYPEGQGLPPIRFATSRSDTNARQTAMMKRQLARVGIRIEEVLLDFPDLIAQVNRREVPFFGFAWASDYPDAENNLALFYSPNASPGSNHANYSRPEYDALYERARLMEPGPERTALYEQMRDMLISDVPFVGSLARNRYFLINEHMKYAKPTQRFWSWFKYLDTDQTN